jgi:hypothetical protein
MTYLSNILASPETNNFSYDVSGRYRSTGLFTIIDGKTIGHDRSDIFDIAGTGTNTFQDNTNLMSVGAGQYLIRQSHVFAPYFSGKPQLVELTFDSFHTETDIIKRFGYFSSSTVAPYNTALDGIFFENDEGTYTFKCYSNGIETINIPFTSFDNYSLIQNLNFETFNVFVFDFLWLGGLGIRIFMKTDNGLKLIQL